MEYIIKKGNNYCSNRIPSLIFSNTLEFKAVFDESCRYKDSGRLDSQKLFGLSNGDHRRDSARFAWIGYDTEIQIYPYVHRAGETVIGVGPYQNYGPGFLMGNPIGSTNFGVEDYYKISISRDEYTFEFNGKVYFIENTNRKLSWIKYELNPYFEMGKNGEHGAPQDMKFKIEKL